MARRLAGLFFVTCQEQFLVAREREDWYNRGNIDKINGSSKRNSMRNSQPPFEITEEMINLIAEISELVGRVSAVGMLSARLKP